MGSGECRRLRFLVEATRRSASWLPCLLVHRGDRGVLPVLGQVAVLLVSRETLAGRGWWDVDGVATEEFLGGANIRLRAQGADIVLNDGLTKTWRLGQTDIPRDD